MSSKNSYKGIDPTIVKNVVFQAYNLKSHSCFINESIEDLEQKLCFLVWQGLDQYDEKRSNFNTFIARLTDYCAREMLRSQQCLKRNIPFEEIDENIPGYMDLEKEAIIRTDISNIISSLPKRESNLCELLKTFTITEASVISKIPKTTVYRILERIRHKFSSLK